MVQAKQERYLFLCHAVYKQNPLGAELLGMLKESFIDKLPVADPDKKESHAYFREGENTLIRSMYQNIVRYEQIIKDNAIKTEKANNVR